MSITSLECIHAVQNPIELPVSPTMFFYERKIVEGKKDEEKIESNMRWIFDFEYKKPDEEIPEGSKFQYNKTEDAGKFANDLKNLNSYMQNVPHVIWNSFETGYTAGGARFTCKREGGKSYGVGYTSSLRAFQDCVEKDLMEAIEKNFKPVSTEINSFQMETVQHENAIRAKASTFVGRSAQMEKCYGFCNNEVGDGNVLILHGEPGCGKSGLLAAVTDKLCRNLRDQENFVFVHVVDSCPGSNILAKMLKRLQWSLRDWRRKNGEINISSDPPESAADLRSHHHQFMTETAEKYPDEVFVIVVDAVNQFHGRMKAWDMWWLPRKGSPPNLKFFISTLNQENGTFVNAREACPDALLSPILQMSREDLQGMITAALARFNKKLTTFDDPLLGNQMDLLLSKSSSPLFLIAACEALRKFGIFEKVSEYIEKLPTSITALFSVLLEEWAVEYGQNFVEDVTGLICLAKDGLLENQINDLLNFKEERMKGDQEFLYESSFSRIYDSLANFLAAGGGGYLRFFHDQLKYTVQDKFLTEKFALETHQWLFDFFLACTESQLCEEPAEDPPAYYEHVLQQIFYHQLEGKKLDMLGSTLRNIYFVRERVLYGQTQSLMDEYEVAIKWCSKDPLHADMAAALTQWMKFSQMYAPKIEESPQFCQNMAINQYPDSWVRQDTTLLGEVPPQVGYPLIWDNIPPGGDAMVCKYGVGGFDVAVSHPSHDVVVIATGKQAVILDQTSGELQHRLDSQSFSVALSPDCEKVYSGEKSGVSVFDRSTGSLIATSNVQLKDVVVWVQHIGDYIAAGAGHARKTICWNDYETEGEIALFRRESGEILPLERKWSVKSPCYDYCYLNPRQLIFSAGKGGDIFGFDLQGSEVMRFENAGECVYTVAPHPTEPTILSGSNDHVIREWNVDSQTMVRSITDTTTSGWFYGGNWSVSYDPTGDFVLSTEPQSQSLRLYSFVGTLIVELKGHADCINKIRVVPGVFCKLF